VAWVFERYVGPEVDEACGRVANWIQELALCSASGAAGNVGSAWGAIVTPVLPAPFGQNIDRL